MAAPAAQVSHKLRSAGIVRGTGHQDTVPDLDRHYDAAIADSAIFRSERQDGQLRSIDGPVEMGSFVSCYQCDECRACRAASCPGGDCPPDACPACATCSLSCLDPGRQPAPHDIWVSFGDQVYAFCSRFAAGDLTCTPPAR